MHDQIWRSHNCVDLYVYIFKEKKIQLCKLNKYSNISEFIRKNSNI